MSSSDWFYSILGIVALAVTDSAFDVLAAAGFLTERLDVEVAFTGLALYAR